MKTNEQIAEKWASEYAGIQVLSTWHIRKAILAALNEAATPQVDWSKAVDWPTEPGLWFMLTEDNRTLLVLVRILDGDFCAVTDTGDCNPFSFKRTANLRFIQFAPPLPSPPAPPAEPDPWDYEPIIGDVVWVEVDDAHGNKRAFGPVNVHGINGKAEPGVLYAGQPTTIADLKAYKHRFAKANVEPPPSGGEK